jgi:hypothetical protein
MFLRIRLPRVVSASAVILLTAASTAHAALIPITIGAFSGSERVVDFTVGLSQPLPYTEEGATFASYSGPLASVLSVNNFLFMAGSGTLQVNFNDPPSRAGFFFGAPLSSGATLMAQVFADVQGTQSLGSLALGTFNANQSGFVGFQADAPFGRADISFAVANASASFRIDDFRFEPSATTVPEPATLIVTLMGAGWFGRRFAGRRRPQR